MKKLFSILLSLLMLFMYSGASSAIAAAQAPQQALKASPNARTIEFAFVFPKNQSILSLVFEERALLIYQRPLSLAIVTCPSKV